MRKAILLGCAGVIGLLSAGRALADLDIPKWIQQPDVSGRGLDVDMTRLMLADDFLCLDGTPLTDAHVWASWRGDAVADHATVAFTLKFYSDRPVSGGGADYSMPDTELWSMTFEPGDYTARLYETLGANKAEWYTPPGVVIADDHAEVWQYNFAFPDKPFDQRRDRIYWLAVEADVSTVANERIGWKTTPLIQWNDNAVWWDGAGWQELVYPEGAHFPGMDLNLAFVITPEPATLALLGLGAAGLVARRRRK